MTDEKIEKEAKEYAQGNFYLEQGFIYGYERGFTEGRKEKCNSCGLRQQKRINLEKENAELIADKEYLDNINLITNSSMSVECAIAESQLGNCCVANRNKNPKAILNNEPPEIQELIDSSAKFLAELIAKDEE